MRKLISGLLFLLFTQTAFCEDGYRLWLRYDRVKNEHILKQYKDHIYGWIVDGKSSTDSVMRIERSVFFSCAAMDSMVRLESLISSSCQR